MRVIAKNKKAFFDYEILEKEIAGIKLQGHEVKSLKTGQVDMRGAYVVFFRGEPYLVGVNIPLYKHANTASKAGYDPERRRKLLLTRKQIQHFAFEREAKKLVLVPLAILEDHGLIKIEIALARPLKKYDKREKQKRKDLQRIREQALKTGV